MFNKTHCVGTTTMLNIERAELLESWGKTKNKRQSEDNYQTERESKHERWKGFYSSPPGQCEPC